MSLLVAFTIFAGPAQRYMTLTAEQLFAPEPYIAIVLETPGKEITHKGHGDEDHSDDEDAADAHGADDAEDTH